MSNIKHVNANGFREKSLASETDQDYFVFAPYYLITKLSTYPNYFLIIRASFSTSDEEVFLFKLYQMIKKGLTNESSFY